MSFGFGVDTLGGLSEKLKQLVNETQEHYESLIDANQLFKKGKVNEKEFFSKIAEYMIASSALSFLSVKVILELKTAIDKGSSIKHPTGGGFPQPSGGELGISGFIGGNPAKDSAQYVMPEPQTEPTFKPVDFPLKYKNDEEANVNANTKNCMNCNAVISSRAKFCSKCGNAQ